MTVSILYSEINLVCVLVLILLCIKVKKSVFIQEQRYLFLKVVISNTLFFMLDSVWVFINNNAWGINYELNWTLNIAYFILSGMLGYYWFCYSEAVQESSFINKKSYKIIILIPVFVLMLATLISFKTGWVFYIDKNNQYHRGTMYFLQIIIAYGYIIVTAVKAFILSFKTDDYRRKILLKTLATFILPTLCGGAFQILFPGYPAICIGNAIGVLYIYLTLQEQLISLDALTRINNRNQLFQYLSTKLKHVRDDKELYLLIMDVDYFKAINDKYGHIEGDRALKSVAGCLMSVCKNKNYFIARYGGDEFVAICELYPSTSIKTVCDSINAKLETITLPYKITVSIGCAKYTPDIKNKQEFIDKADKELYKIKESRKFK